MPNTETGAFVDELLVHVPPEVGSVSKVVNPVHTLIVPPIGSGSGLTVTVAVRIHPVLKV